MRNLIRWILVLILLGVVIFLLINLFNKSKDSTKNKEVNPPVIVEKGETKEEEKPIIKEVEDDTPVIEEETVEVGDTASFAEISVFIGVFTIAFGVFYLKKKAFN